MNIEESLKIALEAHQQGDIINAQLWYNKILEYDPLHFDATHLLGVCHFNNKQYEESKQYIKKAISINDKFPQAHFNLGNTYFSLGNMKEAVDSFKKTINLKPDYIDAYNNLGITLRTIKNFQEAKQVYEKALQIRSTEKLWYNYGNILSDQKNYDEAIKAFETATNINPMAYLAWHGLGNIYVIKKQYKEAQSNYEKVLSIIPNFADSHKSISRVLIKIGQIEKALTHAQAAVNLKSECASTLSNLGFILINIGSLKDAFLCLEKAYRINPRLIECKKYIGWLYCLQGNYQNSMKFYDEAYMLEPENDGLEDGVSVAVLAYLLGNKEYCKKYIELSKKIKLTNLEDQRVPKAYWLLLNKLLQSEKVKNYSTRKNEIIVIGESHSLSYCDQELEYKNTAFQSKVLWVPGCKQWHLGNSKPNHYKTSIKNHLEALHEKSIVLMTVGEIDCRADEGIIRIAQSNLNWNIKEITNQTINRYLDWISQINKEMKHSFIISGVPASNCSYDQITTIRKNDHMSFLATFNNILLNESLKRGFKFLDVYSMTNNGDGRSNGKWHIDEFHLSPSAVQEAFKKHLIH